MSLDAPRICEWCGENIYGFGHAEYCQVIRENDDTQEDTRPEDEEEENDSSGGAS